MQIQQSRQRLKEEKQIVLIADCKNACKKNKKGTKHKNAHVKENKKSNKQIAGILAPKKVENKQ